MLTQILPARPLELLPFVEPLNNGTRGDLAVGDSGSKVLLGARNVNIHNEGENIHSRD
jgi:hypothetical protein